MRIEDLSVNERILVHLMDLGKNPESGDVSMGHTQEGIAEAVGIRINHVPRATNSLLEDGYVDKALVHIGGLKRKRKAYFLTPGGIEMAREIISKLKEQKVLFRDSEGGERNATVQEIIFGTGGATPSTIILSHFRDGVVLETSLTGGNGTAYISNLDILPIPDNFVDRTGEIKFLRDKLDSDEKLIMVAGIKGMGKSTLVWKVLKEFEGGKNIMWYPAHEWDSARSVLEKMSEFFVKLGRNELKRYLRLNRDVNLGQGARAFFMDLRDSDTIMVMDNIFDLRKEVMQFIHLICEESHTLVNSSIVLITREAPDGIPSTGVAGENILTVGGLERDSAMKLMASMGMEPGDCDRVFAMTQGHPLAIKLVNSDEIGTLIDTQGLTKEEVWVVRCMKAFDAIFRE